MDLSAGGSEVLPTRHAHEGPDLPQLPAQPLQPVRLSDGVLQ